MAQGHLWELQLVEDFFDPQFGVKYVGYPTVALFTLAFLLLFLSRVHALGLLMIGLGYVTCWVGYVLLVAYTHHNHHTDVA